MGSGATGRRRDEAAVLHWTAAVGNGATCSGKQSTRVHEERQGEEGEANDRAL
jgi:hypothetical protein